jgi:predicted metalloendopeptidase
LLFEIELAKISQARENRRNATRMYNPMRVGDLQTLAPIIPWVDYINNILTDKIIQVKMQPFYIVTKLKYTTHMYNPMRVGDLQTLAPIIPWVDYINNILTDKIIQVKNAAVLHS